MNQHEIEILARLDGVEDTLDALVLEFKEFTDRMDSLVDRLLAEQTINYDENRL